MELFKHQKKVVKKSTKILRKYGLVYNTSETRTGKTLMTLHTAKKLKVKRVLVLTTKAAINDWYSDHKAGEYEFHLVVTNYEQLHKQSFDYGLVVFDEATRLSSLGKPSVGQKTALAFIYKCNPDYKILLSATPSVESTCQFYYPLKICGLWTGYPSFVKWHADYGIPATKRVAAGRTVMDYSKGRDKKILKAIKHLIVRATREEACFKQHTTRIKEVKLAPLASTMDTYNTMFKDSIVGDILGDTAVKKAQKLQQLCSGFMYDEDRVSHKYGDEKYEWVLENIDTTKKTAIYCLYKHELLLYRNAFADHILSYDEFKGASKGVFISQIQSGAKGIDLSSADRQVFTSLAWSGETFSQAIDRMHRHDRGDTVEVEVLTLGLIDSDILETVKNKSSFQAKQLRKV